MRRLLVVLVSPICALAGIILLLTFFSTVSAGAFPNLPEESGLAAVEPPAASLPAAKVEAGSARLVAPASRSNAGPFSNLARPQARLGPAAPQAALQMEVNYADEWVAGTTDAYASVMITVTNGADDIKETATVSADDSGDYFVSCDDWDSGNCPDIQPGDKVYGSVVGATAEINPVGSISTTADEVENTVSGELDANWFAGPLAVYCDVWEDSGPPSVIKSVDPDGGSFVCDFDDVGWNLQKGQTVAVRYFEPDGDSVINMLVWPWVRVNYGHDGVGADYAPDHTFSITVTDSGGALKALAATSSQSGQGWGGRGGFDTEEWQWQPEQPDIAPGDLVYVTADDGYRNTIEVGTINGALDVDTDTISGQVFAPGFAVSLTVECHPWGAWNAGIGDAPVKTTWAEPDGSVPYSCQWNPATEWDVQPGQQLAVLYQEPDQDIVIDVFSEPAASLQIEKWANGEPAAGGNFLYHLNYENNGDAPAENVVITDTMLGGLSYLADTSGLAHTGSGAGPHCLGFRHRRSRGKRRFRPVC